MKSFRRLYQLLPVNTRSAVVETAEGISQFEPIHKTSFMVGVSTDF